MRGLGAESSTNERHGRVRPRRQRSLLHTLSLVLAQRKDRCARPATPLGRKFEQGGGDYDASAVVPQQNHNSSETLCGAVSFRVCG